MTSRGLPFPARLLCALLVIWEPLAFAVSASSALARLAVYGLPAVALAGYRAVVVGLGIAAGRALWNRTAGGIQLARWWALAHMVATVLTFTTPYFPSNRVPGTKGPTLAALLVIDAAWWLWLTRSRRLREAIEP